MNHAYANRVPPILKRALREYLQRRKSDRAISIANMIRRTRYAMPDLDLTDDELERVISEEVIEGHGNIAFDRRDNQLRQT